MSINKKKKPILSLCLACISLLFIYFLYIKSCQTPEVQVAVTSLPLCVNLTLKENSIPKQKKKKENQTLCT